MKTLLKIMLSISFLLVTIQCYNDDDSFQSVLPETGYFPIEIQIFNTFNSEVNRRYVLQYDLENRVSTLLFYKQPDLFNQNSGSVSFGYHPNNGNLVNIQLTTDEFDFYEYTFYYTQNNILSEISVNINSEFINLMEFNYNAGQNRYTLLNGKEYTFNSNNDLIHYEDEFYSYDVSYLAAENGVFRYQNFRPELVMWFELFSELGIELNTVDLMLWSSHEIDDITGLDQPLKFETPIYGEGNSLTEVQCNYTDGFIITYPNQTFVINYEEREL